MPTTLPTMSTGLKPELSEACDLDIRHLARIHHESLPNDFLPSLGLRFLQKVYYPAALRSSHATTWVARCGDPAGFLTMAHDSPAFSRDILAGKSWTLAYYALRKGLRDPRHLWKSWGVLRSALKTTSDPISAEIVFIAVDATYRGRGVGTQLVEQAIERLRRQGVTACRTKTLATNHGVIAMYEKLGWQVRDHFRFLGNDYVTLAIELLSEH